MHIDLMAETYFVSFVYVQEFIGHTVNGNEFMMAPPAETRKHVIHAHMDAQEKVKGRSLGVEKTILAKGFLMNLELLLWRLAE